MTSIIDETTEQLSAEIGDVARSIGDILGADIAEQIELRLESRCRLLAAELCSEDDHAAAEAARTVMFVRWPEGCEPPPEWWRTPVGRMVARSIGHEDGDSVSRSVAAAILGVHPGTVATLLERGKLERHPDGGITRASVLARLASQRRGA